MDSKATSDTIPQARFELEQELGLGMAPSHIIYTIPASHIPYAACHGVRLLTFNSEEELIKVARHHPEARGNQQGSAGRWKMAGGGCTKDSKPRAPAYGAGPLQPEEGSPMG